MPNFTQEFVKEDNFDDELKKKQPKKKRSFKPFLRLVVILLTLFITFFISSLITSVSTNVQMQGLIAHFNPQITVAYLLTSYFIGYFYQLNQAQQKTLFFASLFLSYFIDFIQGSLFLILIIPVLRKLKLIDINSPSKTIS